MTKANLKVERIRQGIIHQETFLIKLLERQFDELTEEIHELEQELTKKEQARYRMEANVTTFKVVGDYTHPVKTEYSGKLCIEV